MSSVDHSTADAMKPSISKGYHLGSVNSSLVNLYLTPPFPSLSPSCVTLSSRLSVWPYPFIKAQLTCHICSTYTHECGHVHMHARNRCYSVLYCLDVIVHHLKSFLQFSDSLNLQNVLHFSKMSVYTWLQLMFQHFFMFRLQKKISELSL